MSELLQKMNEKMEVIMDVIQNIGNGKKVKEIYDNNQEVFQSITPIDVFKIPAFDKNSTFEDEDIIQMASKLMNLFHTSLENYKWEKEDTSAYVKLYLEETAVLISCLDEMKKLFQSKDWFLKKEEIVFHLNKVNQIEKIFLKSQNIMYPRLEKYIENDRPLQIMWTLQDRVKSILTQLHSELPHAKQEEWIKLIGQFFFLTKNVLDRERLLVLPIASTYLTSAEWEEMIEETLEIGTILRDKNMNFKKPVQQVALLEGSDPFLKNLFLILDQLTVDITFVDENDEVRYFNNTKDRLFVRSKSVIGRKVQNCHPKSSMHVVEEILTRFKNKTQSEAEFYIQMKKKMLYIIYRAIYDTFGVYKGTLEITQDVTHIRSLEGEKRLLDENTRVKKD